MDDQRYQLLLGVKAHKEVTLVHCLKQLLTRKCLVLDDAFFTKRELENIPELLAESVAM